MSARSALIINNIVTSPYTACCISYGQSEIQIKYRAYHNLGECDFNPMTNIVDIEPTCDWGDWTHRQ